MKKKGFTLVELLVVISIIALLMSILMPTLAKVRAMAIRAVCSTNLGSLHKAFLTYALDNHDDYPRAGGKTSRWSAITGNLPLPVFYADNEADAFYQGGKAGTADTPAAQIVSRATMGASLYLLIKYADAAPKEYICGGDRGAVEFELSLYNNVINQKAPDSRLAITQDISLAWDFGGPAGNRQSGGIPPAQHYSYAYQIPYGGAKQMYYSLSTTRQPGTPVMADRNPYLVLIQEDKSLKDVHKYEYGNPMKERWGNSPNHNYEGQNVLFNDSSTRWETVPYCGINQDNIYTYAPTDSQPQIGKAPLRAYDDDALPQSGYDSLLVNEGKQRFKE